MSRERYRCPFCQQTIQGAGASARAFVFNVAVRQMVDDAVALRAGDVLVVVDSTVHPEDHAIHRCDDPEGKEVVRWFRHHATEAYSAINYAIRHSIETSQPTR